MIISGGMHLGCMKLVGEAFKDTGYSSDDRVPILGISNWTTIRGNEALVYANVLILFFKRRIN